jgi:hypothetical protein
MFKLGIIGGAVIVGVLVSTGACTPGQVGQSASTAASALGQVASDVASAASSAASSNAQTSNSAKPTGSSSSNGIAYGPGPGKYKVEKQPPAGSCRFRYTKSEEPLPDVSCTPGALNPKVTQGTLGNTICKSGYTKSIRPPVSITRKEKAANAKSYSYTGSLKEAEYDHLVSLELGGDPNDPRNLWVEAPDPSHKPKDGVNNKKDKVENKLHSAICSGSVSLADAQKAIVTDWTTALSSLGLG